MSSSRLAFNAPDGAIVSASHVAQSHEEATKDEAVRAETKKANAAKDASADETIKVGSAEAQSFEAHGLAQAVSHVPDRLDDSPDVESTREAATTRS